ncbi:hypothetical protein BDV3_000164 [Batrachochytrium dendrobatidis]|uniref:Anti-silencing function protein 1 n=2 Tax=Batrachochytrium dendrobatidis TaxID=109871 RepID=A0A177W768_BATDL|nr:Histone chaperone asf1 [Batrachochytrium dendrobatidis]KAK5672111.1 Histone chaperone asf1 [Batrachochytrium dendrobatidis]OAJ35893.1 hypothetical protein BDEG_20122 [Batrachochytrium dendrobatidis JEL423]
MSLVNLLNVQVLNDPAPFLAPLQFEITFEVVSEVKEDLEFKVIYVGSAQTQEFDQILESVMVGPVPVGVSKFVLEAPAPNPDKIPRTDALGVTVLFLSVLYMGREFVRVGYYVNNSVMDESLVELYDPENPPTTIDFNVLKRSILAEKPKVTRFQIKWDPEVDAAATNNSSLTSAGKCDMMAQTHPGAMNIEM